MILNLNINEDICTKYGINISDALVLLIGKLDGNINISTNSLIEKGLLTSFVVGKDYTITNKGNEILSSVILESDKSLNSSRDFNDLAIKLKELFPKGKKQNTNLYWTEGLPLIIKRLKMFFRKYDSNQTITDEQIIAATKKYVESFKGDYRYMKLLKYFLFKEERNAVGEVESQSELYTYIENADQVEDTQTEIDWETELR